MTTESESDPSLPTPDLSSPPLDLAPAPELAPDHYSAYRFWLLVSDVTCFAGEQMALLITAFLIYQYTHSAVAVGLILLCYNVPRMALAGAANALSLRWGATRACCVLLTAEIVASFVVAGFAFAHDLSVAVLLTWVTVIGICEGLDSPNPSLLRMAMVPQEIWMEYNGAHTRSLTLGTIGGMLLAGVVYSLWGPGWIFIIAVLGFVPPVITFFLFGRNSPELTDKPEERGSVREGWNHLRKDPGSWAALRLMILVFFVSGYAVLLPAIANHIGSRPEILSILEAGTVVGGLFVAIAVKHLHGRVGWSRVRTFCSIMAGSLIGLMAVAEHFGGTRSLVASVIVVLATVPVGFAILMNSTVLIAAMQLITPPRHRSSAYAILALIPLAVAALSQQFVGLLADIFSVPTAFGVLAIITLGANALVSHRPIGEHLQALDGCSDAPSVAHPVRHGRGSEHVSHHRHWPTSSEMHESSE